MIRATSQFVKAFQGGTNGQAEANQPSSRQGGIQRPARRAHEPKVEDRSRLSALATGTKAKEEAMNFEGAIVREQGVTFGIMVVKHHVLSDPSTRDDLVRQASQVFGGIPTVLMGQDSRGLTKYYGRRDIVRFMASVPLSAVPWKRYRSAA